MLPINRILKLIISIESLIISSMIPLYIPTPSINNIFKITEIPINLQIPVVMFLTLIFSGELVTKALSIYMIIGLFLLPTFYDGGSIGYLLTPNFGFLLGLFPLIKIINIVSIKRNFSLLDYINHLIIGIIIMHIIGILYLCIQLFLFNNSDLILYNIGKYSLSKIPFQILMIIPVLILFKIFNRYELVE